MCQAEIYTLQAHELQVQQPPLHDMSVGQVQESGQTKTAQEGGPPDCTVSPDKDEKPLMVVRLSCMCAVCVLHVSWVCVWDAEKGAEDCHECVSLYARNCTHDDIRFQQTCYKIRVGNHELNRCAKCSGAKNICFLKMTMNTTLQALKILHFKDMTQNNSVVS